MADLVPHEGRGKELCDLLRAELGLPGGLRFFEVRFAEGEPINVRCEYVPSEGEPEGVDDPDAEQRIDVSTLDAPDQFLPRTDAADLDG